MASAVHYTQVQLHSSQYLHGTPPGIIVDQELEERREEESDDSFTWVGKSFGKRPTHLKIAAQHGHNGGPGQSVAQTRREQSKEALYQRQRQFQFGVIAVINTQ